MSDVIPSHPAADIWPLMTGDRFEELKVDIAARGLRVPVVLCDGMVLDGRNRYRACLELGIDPEWRVYDGNPYEESLTLNAQRRDLLEMVRALGTKRCLAGSAEWEAARQKIAQAGNQKRATAAKAQPRTEEGTFEPVVATKEPPPAKVHVSRNALAAQANVSPGTMGKAEWLDNKRPDLADKVLAGDMKPTEAFRQMKRDEVSQRVEAFPSSTYRVIYADPPWQYNDVRGFDGYAASAAEDHYPTMSVAELSAMDVRTLADDDAVLLCWATFPLLDDALAVVKAWGFTYKTAFVWDKQRANMGHYHTASAELLLVATRGSGVPDSDTREDQVQRVARGKHSEKPEAFRALIDRLYTHGRRIELFRRGDAPSGWDIWGNEATK